MPSRPRIGRVVIEPTIARRSEADSIADRLSTFTRERLPVLIEEALQGYGEDARERILERVELDFGTVEPDKLEAWLEARLVGLLRAALMDRFGPPRHAGVERGDGIQDVTPFSADAVRNPGTGGASEPAKAGSRLASEFDVDVHLARLAAWFEGRVDLSADTIEQTFSAALDDHSSDVVRLMREQGRHTARRERWVGAMTPAMRIRAVQALRPNDARQVLGDVSHVTARQRAAPVATMRAGVFDDALWQTVFAYLLADRGGRFNRRTFLAALLTGLAARAGLGYVALIDALLERVGSASQQIDRDESLRDILVGLREDADPEGRHEPQRADGPAGHSAAAAPERDGHDDPPADVDARDAQALEFYLDYGARPWYADDDFDPVRVALRLARRTPLQMVMLLRGVDAVARNRRDRAQRRIERLAAALDEPARAEWIMQVEPAAGRRIVAVLAALDALAERTSWSSSKRARLRRAMSVATLEAVVSTRAGAFAEDDWFRRMLAHVADALHASPHEIADALLLATHGSRPGARRMRAVRAGLVGLAAVDRREEGAVIEPAVAARFPDHAGDGGDPRWAERHDETGDSDARVLDTDGAIDDHERTGKATIDTHDALLRAFISAWPDLLDTLRLTSTSFDTATLSSLRDGQRRSSSGSPISKPTSKRTSTSTSGTGAGASAAAADTILSTLTRLARYHGVPLRRWFAALARNAAWRAGDPGLSLIRRWRRQHSRGEQATEMVMRSEPNGAARAFIAFFSTGGTADDDFASWLAMPVEQWLDAALREDGAKVAQRLRAHSADPALMRRLSAYLRPAALARLIAALEPAHAPIAGDVLRAASTMAARIGRPSIDREAHRAVVAALLTPSGGRASLQSIVSRIVDELARRTGIAADRIVEGLMSGLSPAHAVLREALSAKIADSVHATVHAATGAAATAARGATPTPTPATYPSPPDSEPVKTPFTARPLADPAATEPAPHPPERARRALAVVAAYLRYGERFSDARLQAAFADLAARSPHVLRRLIARAVAGDPGRTRLASLANEAFAIVVRVWLPSRAPAAVAIAEAAMAFERAAAEKMRIRAQALWLRYATSDEPRAMFRALIESTLGERGRYEEKRGVEAGERLGERPSISPRTASERNPTSTANARNEARESNETFAAPASDLSARRVLAHWRYVIRMTVKDAALKREWLEWISACESIDEAPRQRPSVRLRINQARSGQKRSVERVTHDTHDTHDTQRALDARTLHAHEAPMPPEAPTEPMRVDNAGIVMLWPFLSRYFDLLGLLHAGRFVDFEAQSRAVYLLHALASNDIARHEAQLPLAKIMCGVIPAVPLAPGADRQRDAREIELSEGLLGGVKQNWDKLRGTSIDGLREAFLMRAGRLRREEGPESSWRLDVETRAYDVLLDTLPWSLSIVRLGWMTDLLTVHWRRRP